MIWKLLLTSFLSVYFLSFIKSKLKLPKSLFSIFHRFCFHFWPRFKWLMKIAFDKAVQNRHKRKRFDRESRSNHPRFLQKFFHWGSRKMLPWRQHNFQLLFNPKSAYKNSTFLLLFDFTYKMSNLRKKRKKAKNHPISINLYQTFT